MNLKNILTEGEAVPQFAKYLRSAERKIRKEMSSYFRHDPQPKLLIEVISPYVARVTLEFQNWLDPKSIDYADSDLKDALEKSDINGHIHKLEVGNATGSEFVEAMISGLKPGMTVKAEAFFPVLEYVITFKQVITKKR